MGVKGLKREWFTLLVIGLVLVLLVYVFIGHQSKQEFVYPPLSFRVDETLLGTSVEDSTLNMRMSMPKGWSRIPTVTFSHVFESVDRRFRQAHERGSLPYIFWQQASGAACVVSRDDTVSLDMFLSTWTGMLGEMYASADVLRTTFAKDSIPFHQFMVNTREVVHLKLICAVSKNPVFAVDYLIPKKVYARELRAIESSIGSIQIVNNE